MMISTKGILCTRKFSHKKIFLTQGMKTDLVFETLHIFWNTTQWKSQKKLSNPDCNIPLSKAFRIDLTIFFYLVKIS